MLGRDRSIHAASHWGECFLSINYQFNTIARFDEKPRLGRGDRVPHHCFLAPPPAPGLRTLQGTLVRILPIGTVPAVATGGRQPVKTGETRASAATPRRPSIIRKAVDPGLCSGLAAACARVWVPA